MMCVFAIIFIGYLLGRISVKGVALGVSGVFIAALLFGGLLYSPLEAQLMVRGEAESVSFAVDALEIIDSKA
ncbi:MAG: hypothetical protein E7672_09640, partial [Ruminococcaceae bacterium]|nr:hypothetical protein [Oscillospiraceae bacterium]